MYYNLESGCFVILYYSLLTRSLCAINLLATVSISELYSKCSGNISVYMAIWQKVFPRFLLVFVFCFRM